MIRYVYKTVKYSKYESGDVCIYSVCLSRNKIKTISDHRSKFWNSKSVEEIPL